MNKMYYRNTTKEMCERDVKYCEIAKFNSNKNDQYRVIICWK